MTDTIGAKRRKRKLETGAAVEAPGRPNICAIAEKLKRLPEYIVYYRKASEVVHSSAHKLHVGFAGSAEPSSPRSKDSGTSWRATLKSQAASRLTFGRARWRTCHRSYWA